MATGTAATVAEMVAAKAVAMDVVMAAPSTAVVAAMAAMTAAVAAMATSQQLWTLGGALVQRAQETNILCGESLTSTAEL